MQQHIHYYDLVGFQSSVPNPDDLSGLMLDPEEIALFIDFDGTLVDLADTPSAVKVSRDDKTLVDGLSRKFGGALAIISGRNLDEVATHLNQFNGVISGCHGAEMRHGGQITRQAEHDADRLEHIKRAVMEFAVIDPRVIAEDKTFGIVLHFRQNPEVESKVRSFVDSLLSNDDEFVAQPAKMAIEIKPRNISKALAIEEIMRHPEFENRNMVFAGDDETDEVAFAYVNEHGGVSIRIGEGPTVAQYRVKTPRAFKLWLHRQLARH